jgi:hypothetical protein
MEPVDMKKNNFRFNKVKHIYEAKVIEEHVLEEIKLRLGYAGIPIYRERERIPDARRYKLSDPGHPDLHGYLPVSFRVKEFYRRHPEYKEKPAIAEEFYRSAIPVYIEVKRPGEMAKYRKGVLSTVRSRTFQAQEEFIVKARKDGCIACFAESWDDVVDAFKQKGYILPTDSTVVYYTVW